MTDERVDDLAIFYQKIYAQFRRKGLSVNEGIHLLTLMICYIAKKSGCQKEDIYDSFNNHWDAWEED
jgi:hypothetical protein